METDFQIWKCTIGKHYLIRLIGITPIHLWTTTQQAVIKRDLIDKKLLIDGKGRLEEWVLQFGRLKKRGEDNLDISAIHYNRGKSIYYYLPDGDRLGIDHHVYILPYAPGTSMIPLPIELLERLDVGFDDPNILEGLL